MTETTTIGKLVMLYRKYKALDVKDFGAKMFLTGDTATKLESSRDDELSDYSLFRLYQFFSATVGVKDLRELKAMTLIANTVRAEMRKRATAKVASEMVDDDYWIGA
ncbi:hypothetical protein IJG91_01375 [Candidatus Saccharibacteria bacterium]|nr:hypothetical protein [Candidatus Saccharibacteria bacterium]MBQ8984674.1 hypothetical protein [Candidatus Saccharibacteria bacterium]